MWADDDATWALLEGVLFPADRVAAADAEIAQVLALAGASSPGTALDMCCGVGRHCCALADRGWTVTGVDRTRRYLDRARAHGGAVEWIEADAREFRRPAAFDLAVNLWTSLGYFETPEEDLAVLRNVRASLGEGGVFVIEMQGREVLCRTWKHREWYEVEGTLVFEERRPVDAWERIESRWVVVRDGVQREVTLAIRSYTGSMLRAALRDAGFANVQLLGGLDGRPYDHEALRLVAVARP